MKQQTKDTISEFFHLLFFFCLFIAFMQSDIKDQIYDFVFSTFKEMEGSIWNEIWFQEEMMALLGGDAIIEDIPAKDTLAAYIYGPTSFYHTGWSSIFDQLTARQIEARYKTHPGTFEPLDVIRTSHNAEHADSWNYIKELILYERRGYNLTREQKSIVIYAYREYEELTENPSEPVSFTRFNDNDIERLCNVMVRRENFVHPLVERHPMTDKPVLWDSIYAINERNQVVRRHFPGGRPDLSIYRDLPPQV